MASLVICFVGKLLFGLMGSSIVFVDWKRSHHFLNDGRGIRALPLRERPVFSNAVARIAPAAPAS